MNEMEETADHVIVIGRGRLVADSSIADFTRRSTGSHVRVVSPRASDLALVLREAGATVATEEDALIVTGMETPRIGYLAAERQIEIHELAMRRASLEAAFMELTEDSVEYQPVDRRQLTTADTN
jgi:ABC-2 type transport system ATP-binding protein